MSDILIGTTDAGTVSIPLAMANRHGLITGATGSGKSRTLQALAEQFSAHGVPVFLQDVKLDLSGIARPCDPDGKQAERARDMGLDDWKPQGCPVRFFDLGGTCGLPMRTSVHEIGPALLARILDLNDVQEGVLNICFRWNLDNGTRMMDLEDLRATLHAMAEDVEDVRIKYGNITPASIGAIQRSILVLDAQGGHCLFGEHALDLNALLEVRDGRGVVSMLRADTLMDHPKMYGAFLLYLLSRLFNHLPEVGDMDKPKLIFAIDEAHALFSHASDRLMEQIERTVRLIRSKGVGVYFVTQNPRDVPDAVAEQLRNRVQHALNAFTPKAMRGVKAAADTFRPNPSKIPNMLEAIKGLETGRAIAGPLDHQGRPIPAELVRVVPPMSHIGPISEIERDEIVRNDPLYERYATNMTREESFVIFVNRVAPDLVRDREARAAKHREEAEAILEQSRTYDDRSLFEKFEDWLGEQRMQA